MGESQTETGGWERTAKDLFAGAAGGIAQVLLGPFSSILLCMIAICQSSVSEEISGNLFISYCGLSFPALMQISINPLNHSRR